MGAQRSDTRDDAGDVTSATTTANTPSGTTQVDCYSYDGFGELTQVFTPGTGSTCQTTPSASVLGGPAPIWNDYSYDTKTGDRTGETVHATTTSGSDATASYAYPDAGGSQPHAVTSVSGAGAPGAGTYKYDEAGDATTVPGQTLTYDAQGRLASDTTSAGTQKNIYDASGTLLLQIDPTQGATLFLGDTVLHQKGTDPVSAVRTYSTQGGAPVAERAGSTGGAVSLTWLFTDVDGNVDVQTDATVGTTKDSYRDPFGNPVTGTGVWGDGNGFLNHPSSTSTGLTSLGARFYDAAIGRFVTLDPLLEAGDPQQIDGYGYAGNNPITLTDPTGLEPMMKQCAKSNMRACESYYYGGSWTAGKSKPSVSQHGVSWVESDLNVTAAKACNWESTCVSQQPNRYQAGKGYNPAPGSLAGGCSNWYGCAKQATRATLSLGLGLSLMLGPGDLADLGAGLIAKFVARDVAKSAGDHIVLGLRAHGLEQVATKVGGRTLLRDPDWMASLQKGAADPSTKFTVNLDGMSGSSPYSQVMGAATRGASGTGGYTDWEMAQLFQAGRLPDVTFVGDGALIENPWATQ